MHIVLVHGSFQTGECWYRLSPLLKRRGFTVHTPTLSGQNGGKPVSPLRVTWKTYADDIIDCAESAGEPVILLGHSLAGFAISAAAERRPDLVSSLIYLSAAVPKLGRSTLRDTVPSRRPEMPRSKFRTRLTFPRESAVELLYHRCPADVAHKARSIMSPQPFRPLLGAIHTTRAGLGSVPKHYFASLDDRIIPFADQQKRRTNLDFDSVRTLDSDHCSFLSAPEALADAIGGVP